MSNRAVASAEALPEPASALEGLAEQFREVLGGPSPIERLPSIRQTISDLHAEAVRSGRDTHSRALVRIGLLTEVWECLISDSSSSADEVGFFCVKAVSQLARGNGGDDGGVVAWILDDSASTWGEYLALLEGQELGDAADPEPIADPEPQSDDLSEFDAEALLRLFTGSLGGVVSPEAATEDPKVNEAAKPASPKSASAATTPKQQPPFCQPASALISAPPKRRPDSPPRLQRPLRRNRRPGRLLTLRRLLRRKRRPGSPQAQRIRRSRYPSFPAGSTWMMRFVMPFWPIPPTSSSASSHWCWAFPVRPTPETRCVSWGAASTRSRAQPEASGSRSWPAWFTPWKKV